MSENFGKLEIRFPELTPGEQQAAAAIERAEANLAEASRAKVASLSSAWTLEDRFKAIKAERVAKEAVEEAKANFAVAQNTAAHDRVIQRAGELRSGSGLTTQAMMNQAPWDARRYQTEMAARAASANRRPAQEQLDQEAEEAAKKAQEIRERNAKLLGSSFNNYSF